MDARPATRVLIAGVSTRAAAESAARAGFVVTSIDAFGDLDQHPAVRSISLPRDLGEPFTAEAAAKAGRGVTCDAVVYLSNFENHPEAVDALAAGRPLWGNAPAVLRRVRDPLLLTRALGRRGFAVPAALGASAPPPANRRGGWLMKPVASGGGHRVRPWRRGTNLPPDSYLQELVEGTPGAVVFVAAGGRAAPLGVSRQLIGERTFGAKGYRYCGSILAGAGDDQFTDDEALMDAASALARAVTLEFDVVGVNGIDFIARNGVPYPVEVNPRWSSSMELVERAYGISTLGAHATACDTGTLPDFDLVRARRGTGATGKAVVFARRDITVGDTRAWLENLADASIRDVPNPGQRISAGRPVCTVYASGADSAACYTALVRRAEHVYAALEFSRADVRDG
jgi:predicted ATP-grasp superfamily ATP-dependent carboligase